MNRVCTIRYGTVQVSACACAPILLYSGCTKRYYSSIFIWNSSFSVSLVIRELSTHIFVGIPYNLLYANYILELAFNTEKKIQKIIYCFLLFICFLQSFFCHHCYSNVIMNFCFIFFIFSKWIQTLPAKRKCCPLFHSDCSCIWIYVYVHFFFYI